MKAAMAGEIHLSLCQQDMRDDVEGRTGPVQGFEMVLAQFAGDDDRRQQADSHAEGDALLECLNAVRTLSRWRGECLKAPARGRVFPGNCIPLP